MYQLEDHYVIDNNNVMHVPKHKSQNSEYNSVYNIKSQLHSLRPTEATAQLSKLTFSLSGEKQQHKPQIHDFWHQLLSNHTQKTDEKWIYGTILLADLKASLPGRHRQLSGVRAQHLSLLQAPGAAKWSQSLSGLHDLTYFLMVPRMSKSTSTRHTSWTQTNPFRTDYTKIIEIVNATLIRRFQSSEHPLISQAER